MAGVLTITVTAAVAFLVVWCALELDAHKWQRRELERRRRARKGYVDLGQAVFEPKQGDLHLYNGTLCTLQGDTWEQIGP